LKNKLENSKMVAIGRGPPAGRILAMAGNNPAASRPSHGWSQPSHTPAHPGHARNSIRRTKRGARGDSNPRPHCLEAVELPLSYLSFCNLCLWYMLFILFMMPRQNNKKKWWGNKGSNPSRWGREALSYHCAKISLVSCSSIFPYLDPERSFGSIRLCHITDLRWRTHKKSHFSF
jgi:hypothetical protein